MKKLFIASIILFACSLGLFGGAIYIGCCKANAPCPRMEGKGPHGPGMPGPHAGIPDDMKEFQGKERHSRDRFQAEMDSVLQVTPEQKASLEQQRNEMDSSFKALRKQKMDAEKQLKEALDSDNLEQINAAKASVLAANEAMLNQRIQGAANLSKILTKEQMAKFREFQKEKFQKFHKGPKGPRHHEEQKNVNE